MWAILKPKTEPIYPNTGAIINQCYKILNDMPHCLGPPFQNTRLQEYVYILGAKRRPRPLDIQITGVRSTLDIKLQLSRALVNILSSPKDSTSCTRMTSKLRRYAPYSRDHRRDCPPLLRENDLTHNTAVVCTYLTLATLMLMTLENSEVRAAGPNVLEAIAEYLHTMNAFDEALPFLDVATTVASTTTTLLTQASEKATHVQRADSSLNSGAEQTTWLEKSLLALRGVCSPY